MLATTSPPLRIVSIATSLAVQLGCRLDTTRSFFFPDFRLLVSARPLRKLSLLSRPRLRSTVTSACLRAHSASPTARLRQLYNPATGQPYPNNFINPTTFNTPALNMLKLIPVSSDPCGQNHLRNSKSEQRKPVHRPGGLGSKLKEHDLRQIFYRRLFQPSHRNGQLAYDDTLRPLSACAISGPR